MSIYDIDIRDLPVIITLPASSELDSFRAIADEIIHHNDLKDKPHAISVSLLLKFSGQSAYLVENKL